MMSGLFIAADSSDAPTVNMWQHALEWVGRFHVLTVHFPIALICAGALAEGWFMVRRQSNVSPTVRYCLVVGAAGAAVAAALGWPHAMLGGFGDNASATLAWHRWLGTATAAVAIVTAGVGERDARRGSRSRFFRVLVFGLALMVTVTAHLGGMLTHGDDFLKW
jgi:uncharacterized membrane protein